ncbi:intraflagellar transport protein [Apis mellifera caucasica]|uniref:Intraflagellar transport protein 122 homolog n=1 Tax=Apis mellifera TaxID=7460 RepID=A0A7M7MPL1_APIME|nr:intraflagellar transport protein 122 homolog [Apis mellifera]KAG6796046.1 intraflagellar transport protein [Apis mellifera caucasica]KAG9430372.1 intraflagellar transport protein [Apis mellifera carnica]|eukprot:XP_026299078.1 intraflagellar transport protein 122 homolog [Apis mellifera]
MKASPTWVDKVQDKFEQCIYDLCFNPDGTQLVIAAGQQVLVYETNEGTLIQPLKGHKDVVYCVCYAKDGKKFASGSADKSVIIWTSRLEGILKYSHNEAVQTMQFNPVSHQLLSCSLSDIAFWSPEQKAVVKHKSRGRVNCCAWTRDGQYLAIGLASGYVSIRNKNGEEQTRIERQTGTPIWSLLWNRQWEESTDVLCIAEWNGTISFYSISGKPFGKDRLLNFIPLKMCNFAGGQYILVCGSNKQCILMTYDGIQLINVGGIFSSWIWSCAVHPTSTHVALGCQDGIITYLQLSWDIIHGLYGDRYAYRENMTDVIIQNLITSQKVRIKCKDLIHRIAVYKNRLAVQLSERVIIYEPLNSNDGMHYRIYEKLNQALSCNLLVITTNNLILCTERRLQSLSFNGIIEREWILDGLITYIKVIGGPIGQECLIIGLNTGYIVKIYLDNPFPAYLLKIESSVRCLDISSLKEKLAVVSDHGILYVFDLYTEEKLQEFQNVNSVAFNTCFEEIMCFSTGEYLAIKVGNFTEYRQKFSGLVMGHNKSKVYCLNGCSIVTIEVPLSLFMYQYIDISLFSDAYNIACLGVADSDWFALGIAALENLELNIAYSSFARVKNLRYIEVLSEVEEKLKSGEWGREACMATTAAAMGKLKDAAKLFQKAGLQQYALTMYSDLRMFDIAQEFIVSGNNQDRTILLRKRAEWAKSLGEPRAAAEMFLSAGDIDRAINIIAEYGWIDMLIKVGRQLDKTDRDNLTIIAKKLKRLGATHGAAEIFSRLGDDPDVADVLVEAQAWPEAFELAERNPKLKARIYGPYARWLAETGHFSEAQKAFQIAGQSDESIMVLIMLAKNAVTEKRFRDASYFYLLLSQISLNLNKTTDELQTIFLQYYEKAEIYYAYHEVHKYVEEPFTSLMPDALFNIARFLLIKTENIQIEGISRFIIIYTLLKQANFLGANKLSMQLLEKLRKIKIPINQFSHLEISNLNARASSYKDPEELLPLCYKCSTFNPLLPSNNEGKCVQCGLKFQYSFVMFEILPLVEFELEESISDEEAEKLINESSLSNDISDTDQFSVNTEVDLFTARLMKYEEKSSSTIIVGRNVLKSMDPCTVLIIKWPKPFKTRYFKNLLPDLQITFCKSCLKLFHLDDYELALLRHGYCPFCRTINKISN